MDILLRDIDPVIVQKIDEVAKKRNQSRQIFLKSQIELLATDFMQSEKVNHLEKQLQANTLTLKEVAKTMNEMNSIIKYLVNEDVFDD